MGLFDFMAGAPTDAPSSYPAMEARRRIALQLLSQGGRKGYPRNIGEGLTAIGDAIGERGVLNSLQQMEKGYQQNIDKEAADAVPVPQKTSEADVPERTAEVAPAVAPTVPSYTYPQTASLPAGDTMSDADPQGATGIVPTAAPVVPSPSPVAVNPQRNALAIALQGQQPRALGAPPVNPTLGEGADWLPPSPLPTAGSLGGQQPDIRPAPPDLRLAQAASPVSDMPPAIKPPGALPEPVPATTPYPGIPQVPPKSVEQLRAEAKLSRAQLMGDPQLMALHKGIVDRFEADRQQNYQNSLKAWEATPGRARAADEAQQRAYQEGITRMLGGVPQEVYIANLNKSKENVAGIPAATQSIRRARDLVVGNKMFTGPFADTETFLSKAMGSAGFPVDPKASGTEQFKQAMGGVLAQARKSIVGPGAQSDNEMKILQSVTAADAKLTPDTIKAALDAAEHLNLQSALDHQKRVRRFAGENDKDRQAQVYGAYGVDNMADIVPQSSVNKLFKFSSDPQVHRDFDNTYHTPGLSREVLRFRRPQ